MYGGRNVVVPTLRDGPSELLRQQREADDVGDLALVGAHAERRVALEMLDRLIAFARGERDVVDGDVVLPVDEALRALRAARDAPQRQRRSARDGDGLRGREAARAAREARLRARREPRGVAFGQRRGEIEARRSPRRPA